MTISAVIYRAPHLRQLVSSDPYGKYNCTAYAAARAINAATLGGLVISGAKIRALSDEPIPSPSSPGLNIRQVCAVSRTLRVPLLDRTAAGEGWDDVVGYLDVTGPGRRVVAQVDYAHWPDPCQASTGFLHAVTLDAIRHRGGTAEVLASDPLCSTLKWYRAGAVRDAMAAFTGSVNRLSFALTREIPLIALVT
jgi:hypothetical protein